MSFLQRFLGLGALTAVLFLCGGQSILHAQVDNGDTGNTGNATGDTGATTGAGFNPEEPDLSVFDGIDRSAETSFGGTGLSDSGTGTTARGGGGGGVGGFGGLGGFFGGLSQAFGGGGQGSTEKPAIRVRLRSAVQVAPLSGLEIQRGATRSLQRVPQAAGLQGVSVSMDQGTAVISGTVRSEKERRMSQLLLMLEPGVKRVDNQVTVTP